MYRIWSKRVGRAASRRRSMRRMRRSGHLVTVLHDQSIEEFGFNILRVGEQARQSGLLSRAKRVKPVNLASDAALEATAERNVALG